MREFKDVEELSAVKFTDETGTHVFTEEDEVICIANGEVYIGMLKDVMCDEEGQIFIIHVPDKNKEFDTTSVAIPVRDMTYFARKEQLKSNIGDASMDLIEKMVENKMRHKEMNRRYENLLKLNEIAMDKITEYLIESQNGDERLTDALKKEIQVIGENLRNVKIVIQSEATLLERQFIEISEKLELL